MTRPSDPAPAVNGQSECRGVPGAPGPVAEAAPPPFRRKLLGREFYESLGSPKMILAPMVDRSEFAWRMLTRSFMDTESSSPLLTYSPMFHARLFNTKDTYRQQHFEALRPSAKNSTPQTTPYLDGNPSIDRPLFVQFCANDPKELLEAAKHVEPYCDAVDLNLGCPQGIARKGHYGAFLQEQPDLIYQLINKLHTGLSIPVTAKFRIQETKEKTLEYAKMILSAGASIIAVHGRQREQKGHNTGVADWSYIRYLRDNLPPDTVIFANGNILNHGDIEACMEATGADGVMSAEGNLSDPTIFSAPPPVGSEGRAYWRGRDGKGGYRLDFMFRRYMDTIYKYVLEAPSPKRPPLFLSSDPPTETTEMQATEEPEEEGPPTKKRKKSKGKETKSRSPNLGAMQGHLFQLLRPLVTKHTDVRDTLAKARGGDMPTFEDLGTLIDQAVKAGIQEYEQFPERFQDTKDVAGSELTGSKATIAVYKRPWWVCQPHVRPLPEEAVLNGAMTQKKNALVKEAGGKDAKDDMCGCEPCEADDVVAVVAADASDKENHAVNG
ncbi:hypothetical protein AJ80_01769 [Polytolypa hystricis UAMH7299]|uniref:tRNA-dihydrouridine(16/17) synthase [NAD(P)(+)] n=1 Tax=Polytolypa hystricis (strain UAMH7299) TaxID=1447883 RepID=A0A2B7YXR9_POLH7|nr:hypothetical protein AJ80_01769 [Polytolypa hystricis UAMH7299]